MPELLLGPLVRHVGIDDATVWVETDSPCEVDVLGRRARTFHVAGHHYALVVLEGLDADEQHSYEVRLDGERRWPERDSSFPPSVIRTLHPDRLRLAFGSCRVTAPHGLPYRLPRSAHPQGRGVDALAALVERMRRQPPESWPDALLLLGDQVYADEVSPQTRAFIRSRRDTHRPHGEEVADLEEYTRLYREAWGDPAIRWLLSTVPSAMIFDDHDVHDDWNTSAAWKRELEARPWWRERIVGAISSYWLYQHLGNLSLHELAEDALYAALQRANDGEPILRDFAIRADRETAGSRWSYRRDYGRVRLVVIDSRAGRLLEEGRREMLDDAEWDWVEAQAVGDCDHLLLATSLPYLMPPAIHFGEAWNEAVCAGAWGERAAAAGERLRRSLDLEHWASFRSSFERLAAVLHGVARGERGEPPATTLLLSGDIHCSYLAEVDLEGAASAVYQAVCSPLRNELSRPVARTLRHAWHAPTTAVLRLLAQAAGVGAPPVRWHLTQGPCFENAVMTLTLEGRRAALTLERARAGGQGEQTLEPVFSAQLPG